MKHERGGGEVWNQCVLINSQSYLCKRWKIQSRLANRSSRHQQQPHFFHCAIAYTQRHTKTILSSAHTQLVQSFHSPHWKKNCISLHLGLLGEGELLSLIWRQTVSKPVLISFMKTMTKNINWWPIFQDRNKTKTK